MLITKADKSNTTVAIDKKKYISEVQLILSDENTYQVYKYETGNDIYVSLGKTIRSVKPNH